MAVFQSRREHTEKDVMLHLLQEIEENSSPTQRFLASELNVALGLMNTYLKRCITKGWIRVNQVSPKRITYFLTPEGFREKSLMVKDYLARSMSFFRDAKIQCEERFIYCKKNKWGIIALVGEGDLAQIAQLVAQATGLKAFVVPKQEDLSLYDAVMITDIIQPQQTFEGLQPIVSKERLLILELLHISRHPLNK